MNACLDADLILMIKNPIMGRVKTRLAKDIGDENALAIYLVLLERTLSLAKDWRGRTHIFFSDYVDPSLVWDCQFLCYIQSDGDLGQRLIDASKRVFLEHPNTPKLIIGSDCYDLGKTHLEAALQILKDNDFVLGPSEDGGYYLIGMKEFSPFVFQGVQWSTATVFEESVQLIEDHQKIYKSLPVLLDIDDISALNACAGLKDWMEKDRE